MPLTKRVIAELVGTYVLVLLGTLSIVSTIVFFKGVTSAGLFLIGFAFGVGVLTMVYAFGHISGTHINPAVSIALWATGRLPARDLGAYITAQLIGAVLASITIVGILGHRAVDAGLGGTLPGTGVSYWQAILSEAVMTFFLVTTVWGTAVDNRAAKGFAGLAIGVVVAADIWVSGPITGASMNPARTFGPILTETFWGGKTDWGKFPIYLIGPIVGGLVAAFLFDYIGGLKKAEPQEPQA